MAEIIPFKKDEPIMATPKKMPNYFDGLSVRQCQDYASEMYKLPEFKDDVIKATQKVTLIDIEGFRRFLKHMENKRFGSGNE